MFQSEETRSQWEYPSNEGHFEGSVRVLAVGCLNYLTGNRPPNPICLRDAGINVVRAQRQRHVLTTRRDGTVSFEVAADGSFSVRTEHQP